MPIAPEYLGKEHTGKHNPSDSVSGSISNLRDDEQLEEDSPSGEHDSNDIAHNPLNSLDGSASAFSSSSHSSSTQPSEDGMAAACSQVEYLIQSLGSVSDLMSNPGFRLRDFKVESFIDIDEEGNNLTSQYTKLAELVVTQLYPKANAEIRHRLAKAMSQRRNRFAYRRRHQQRLARLALHKEHPLQNHQQDLMQPGKQLNMKSHEVLPQTQLTEIRIALPLSTSAVSIKNECINTPAKVWESFSSNILSSISASTVHTTSSRYPKAPDIGNEQYFECPYCYIACPAKDVYGKYWR